MSATDSGFDIWWMNNSSSRDGNGWLIASLEKETSSRMNIILSECMTVKGPRRLSVVVYMLMTRPCLESLHFMTSISPV